MLLKHSQQVTTRSCIITEFQVNALEFIQYYFFLIDVNYWELVFGRWSQARMIRLFFFFLLTHSCPHILFGILVNWCRDCYRRIHLMQKGKTVGGRVRPRVGNGVEVAHKSSCFENSSVKEESWSLLTCEPSGFAFHDWDPAFAACSWKFSSHSHTAQRMEWKGRFLVPTLSYKLDLVLFQARLGFFGMKFFRDSQRRLEFTQRCLSSTHSRRCSPHPLFNVDPPDLEKTQLFWCLHGDSPREHISVKWNWLNHNGHVWNMIDRSLADQLPKDWWIRDEVLKAKLLSTPFSAQPRDTSCFGIGSSRVTWEDLEGAGDSHKLRGATWMSGCSRVSASSLVSLEDSFWSCGFSLKTVFLIFSEKPLLTSSLVLVSSLELPEHISIVTLFTLLELSGYTSVFASEPCATLFYLFKDTIYLNSSECLTNTNSFNLCFLLLFFFPALRYNQHITFCKFKVYNVIIWYTYMLQNDCHNKVG